MSLSLRMDAGVNRSALSKFGKVLSFDIEYFSSADVIADIETTPVVMPGSAFLTTCKTVIVKPEVA